MKKTSILVISVIIKLQDRVVFRSIFSLNMKVSNILVISVIIKLQDRVILRDTFGLAILEIHLSMPYITIIYSDGINMNTIYFFQFILANFPLVQL